MTILTPNPRPNWYQRYAEELERYPALLAALYEDNPIRAVARRAKLSELEASVLKGWAQGESDRELARAFGRSHTTIQDVALKARYKILLWLVRAWSGHYPTG